jgi:hypothetical protein
MILYAMLYCTMGFSLLAHPLSLRRPAPHQRCYEDSADNQQAKSMIS